MKDFFSNFFGRNNDPKSIVSFDAIDAIYSELYNGNNNFEFKMKGIYDTVVDLCFFKIGFLLVQLRTFSSCQCCSVVADVMGW